MEEKSFRQHTVIYKSGVELEVEGDQSNSVTTGKCQSTFDLRGRPRHFGE